ncbi:MAG: cation transporter [Duncaniella sp.]|nr:cation transporter [Duncaniella sp.]
MKRILSLALMLVSIAVIAGAKAPADTTVIFNVMPKMSCQNCENKIKSNLRFEKGIKSIETSIDNQTVKVAFNPKKTNVENIQKGFKKIGYAATLIPECEDGRKEENKTIKE